MNQETIKALFMYEEKVGLREFNYPAYFGSNDSPRGVAETIALLENGLIVPTELITAKTDSDPVVGGVQNQAEDFYHDLTERGKAYIQALTTMPLPIQQWVIPR